MNWRTMAPLALSITLLGATVVPATAQRYDRDGYRYDRYNPYDQYDRDGYRLDRYGNWVDRNGNRVDRYDRSNRTNANGRYWTRQRVNALGPWRSDLADRVQAIADRASRLRDQNRLSDRHYNEVLDKLERVRRDVNGTSGETLDRERYRADMDWMDDVERDMDNWSRADRRR